MKEQKINIQNLLTIKNYALGQGVTPAYIYKLIKANRMEAFIINDVYFIETDKFPSIPVPNRRK